MSVGACGYKFFRLPPCLRFRRGRFAGIPSARIFFARATPTTLIRTWRSGDTTTDGAGALGAGPEGTIFPSDAVYVGSTESRGRGVFARRAIAAGELIEVCPVIILGGADEQELLDRTRLYNYYFAWGEHPELAAVALGYGSLYNHSYHANADHVCDVARGEIRISAHRAIRKDEEITINYGGRPDCPDPVWFDVVEEDG